MRTVENARRTAFESTIFGEDISVATTYAFGGDQHTASTQIEVRAIDVQIRPESVSITPGAPVMFVAVVSNALDSRVRWTSSAGEFEEIVDFGVTPADTFGVCPDGTIGGETVHEAKLLTANVSLEEFPITVTVKSVAACGLRAADGAPERKGVAFVQTGDPTMLMTLPRACVAPGTPLNLGAELVGLREEADDGQIRWTTSGSARVNPDGRFTASSSGTYEVTATYSEDPSVNATSIIEVGADCCGFGTNVSQGPGVGYRTGPAHLAGPSLILSDVSGTWSVNVAIPSFEPGVFDTAMSVNAEFPYPDDPTRTIMAPADAPDGEPTVPATIYIDRVEGEFGMRNTMRPGVVEGRLVGRAGWRYPPEGPGGDIYFDLDAEFKAVKYAVGPVSPYQQCREGWGLESTGDLLREEEGVDGSF